MSKFLSSVATMSLISLEAKKRPGHACLPCPKNMALDGLVVTNWNLVEFSLLAMRKSENRKPLNSSDSSKLFASRASCDAATAKWVPCGK